MYSDQSLLKMVSENKSNCIRLLELEKQNALTQQLRTTAEMREGTGTTHPTCRRGLFALGILISDGGIQIIQVCHDLKRHVALQYINVYKCIPSEQVDPLGLMIPPYLPWFGQCLGATPGATRKIWNETNSEPKTRSAFLRVAGI